MVSLDGHNRPALFSHTLHPVFLSHFLFFFFFFTKSSVTGEVYKVASPRTPRALSPHIFPPLPLGWEEPIPSLFLVGQLECLLFLLRHFAHVVLKEEEEEEDMSEKKNSGQMYV